ncbi:MAG TPA: hypothetical protein EYP41_14215 [Anaerolineae bacterium]|nr:hypothetical protein [Anaerolineae bacterium]HIP71220.1 hypothetical protein [Anaerolineae bacterium]
MLRMGRIVTVVSGAFFFLVFIISWIFGAGAEISTAADTTVTLTETRKLIPSSSIPADDFGVTLVLSGDLAVVGAPGQAMGGNTPGVVHIFGRDTGGPVQWGEAVTLTAGDGVNGDSFGVLPAYSAGALAVGAPFATVNGNTAQGAVYLFARGSRLDSWTFVRKITAVPGSSGDGFGIAALDNGRLLVGAPNVTVGSNPRQGAAYLFEQDAGGPDNWGQTVVLTASDGVSNDYFGDSVVLSGDTAVVNQYIFSRQLNGNWTETTKLAAADGLESVLFGHSAAMSGDIVALGDASAEVNGQAFQGAVYLYGRHQNGANQWGQIRKITVTSGLAGDSFGTGVALSGDMLVVGAPGADKAYVFRQNAGGENMWGLTAVLTGSDVTDGSEFGIGTAVDRGLILVGARTANAVYLFDLRSYLYLPFIRQ